MFMDETTYTEIEKSTISPHLKDAGLYVQSKEGDYFKVVIPDDYLAFQIGEAAQVASRGLLKATPHLVRGAFKENMARNTFAVFMQV